MNYFAKVYSAQTILLKAHLVNVEVDITKKTLQAFSIIGLPDKAVEEARDRVSAAIKNSGFTSPKQSNQKVVASLAPADVKKEGPLFDVALALCFLLADQKITFDPDKKLFIGELALDGGIRKVRGVLPLVMEAKLRGFKEIYVPKENAQEAALIDGLVIYGIETLSGLITHLESKVPSGEAAESTNPLYDKRNGIRNTRIERQPRTPVRREAAEQILDFSDVRGQETAKRGLEIAAAGRHNIALFGPAGTGKTMLARAFCGILPPLSFEDILETTAIHSVAGILGESGLQTEPPFRAPHHTTSYIAVVGGGAIPKPGEVTLAHRGVLFADEFPEFDRTVLEALRQPLEDRVVSISRAKGSAIFPANFILIAAMNPCPCGNFGTDKECICLPVNLARYQRRLSGPIMDRIDMWIEVPKIAYEKLSDPKLRGESSKLIRERVLQAREQQRERFKNLLAKRHISTNSEMSAKDIDTLVPLSETIRSFLNASAEKYNLSARAYHRIIKLARTIGDLAGSENVTADHLLEALQYRRKTGFNY